MGNAAGSGWAHAPSGGGRGRGGGLAAAALCAVALTLVLSLQLAEFLDRVPVAQPGAAVPSAAEQAASSMPAFFERNAGQVADRRVRFLARTEHSDLFLTSTSAVIASPHGTLTMRLDGGDPRAPVRAAKTLPRVVSYLVGHDRSQWHTDIPTSEAVRYSDVYPGIDLEWYGADTELEYDFVVAPGADPGRIAIDLRGAERVRLGAGGDLLITMRGDTVLRQKAPVLFQRIGAAKVGVPGRYVLSGTTVRFDVGAYDRSRALTIDPLLYSTISGTTATRQITGVAVDDAGNASWRPTRTGRPPAR